mgnify:FL=1
MIDSYAAARLIANRGDLRRKAVNFKRGHDVRLTPELRSKIEKVIVETQADFEASAVEALRNLKDAWNSASLNSVGRARYYEWIYDVAMDLKGQGSLFGYPLVTLYADVLKNLVAGLTHPTSRLHAIIGLNIDALGIIIRRRITGPGSTLERRVAEALREAYVKMRLRVPSEVAVGHKVATAVRQLDGKRPTVVAPELKDTARQWPTGTRLPVK